MAEWRGVRTLKLPRIATAINWKTWLLAAVSATMVWGLLLGSISLGLQTASTRVWPHAQAGRLDYTSRPLSTFAKLTSAFVSRTLGLGSNDGVGVTTARGRSSSASTSRKGVVVVHPFDNDDFASARDISALPFTAKTNTSGATREEGEPTDCALVGGTVWYQYRPQSDDTVSVTTVGTDYSTSLGVFAGTSLGGLRDIGCDTHDQGDAWVTFASRAGTSYYIQVTAPVSGGGNLSLSLDLTNPGTLTSITDEGVSANLWSSRPSISSDGRFVLFQSQASNLVPGDSNDATDVFVRDRIARTTTRASLTWSGGAASSSSFAGIHSMSEDGRFVAFESFARNLVPDDTNGDEDIFVRDLVARTTFRVSVSSTGGQGDHGGISAGAVPAPAASISADGRFVAFHSWNFGLVPNDTNSCPEYGPISGHSSTVVWVSDGCPDIFVRDVVAKTTTRVSTSSSGAQANNGSMVPVISSNGRYVSFYSWANNLVPNDTNGTGDYFVHDRLIGRTSRVSVSSSGEQAIADDKEWRRSSTSADGRFVAFASIAPNLVPNDTNQADDVFVRDQMLGTTIRVNVSSSGEQASLDSDSRQPSLSPDGRYVAFESTASNLVPGDTNGVTDIFLHDMHTRSTIRLSVTESGQQGNGRSFEPWLSADGRFVTFSSNATNFVPWDRNGTTDIFVFPTRIFR